MAAKSGASLVAPVVKNLSAMQKLRKTQVRSLGWEDPLEEEMAIQSSPLARRIPWMEEPGGLQSLCFLLGRGSIVPSRSQRGPREAQNGLSFPVARTYTPRPRAAGALPPCWLHPALLAHDVSSDLAQLQLSWLAFFPSQLPPPALGSEDPSNSHVWM